MWGIFRYYMPYRIITSEIRFVMHIYLNFEITIYGVYSLTIGNISIYMPYKVIMEKRSNDQMPGYDFKSKAWPNYVLVWAYRIPSSAVKAKERPR